MNNNCHRCGTVINPGEKFCRGCGVELLQTQGNQSNMNPQIDQEVTNQPNMNPQVDQGNPEMILLESFMGPKAKKIMSSGFSFPSFFFGPMYLIYRKMYLYGFGLWILQTLLSSFVPKVGQVATLVIEVFLAIKFRDLYTKHAKDEIENIKKTNPGVNFEGLNALARKKGGVNKVLPIIFGILMAIIVIFAIVFSFVSISGNKLVCESTEGNITISYNEEEVTGYFSTGAITYDLDEQQKVSRQIGTDRYVRDFTSWFETNTSGTCSIELKE